MVAPHSAGDLFFLETAGPLYPLENWIKAAGRAVRYQGRWNAARFNNDAYRLSFQARHVKRFNDLAKVYAAEQHRTRQSVIFPTILGGYGLTLFFPWLDESLRMP